MKSKVRFTRLLLVFFVASSIEVRVKASSLEDAKVKTVDSVTRLPLQIPENCFVQKGLCALHNLEQQPLNVPLTSHQVVIDSKTSIVRKTDNRVQFLSGQMLAGSVESFVVETEYGDVDLSGAQALFVKKGTEIEVRSLRGEVKINLKGGKEQMLLTPGYRVKISGVTKAGFNQVTVPDTADLKLILRDWGGLYQGDLRKFREEFVVFHESWSKAIAVTGKWHKRLVDRQIASLAAERAKQALRRKKIRRENQKLIDIFKRKNYLF